MPDAKVLRVFIVDDDLIIASTLTRILERNGFSVAAFTSPLDVLGALKAEDLPDLLLCDGVMPGVTGIELGLRIKEVCPDCVVLLFSGQDIPPDLLLMAHERGYDFPILPKPIDPCVLMAEIRRYARKRGPLAA
jgi:DNA-binding NtrC family response regulator